MFGASGIVRNSDKEKWLHSGYGTTFDGADSWNFDNDFDRDDVIFSIGNSSSSHANNHWNKFLVLGEGPTYCINESFGSPEKKFSIKFSKAKTKICLSLHCNGDNSYFRNEKEIFKFKANNKNVNFSTQFFLGIISNGFAAIESREVSLKGNMYDFSFDYNSFHKSRILNIHNYLMVNKNV